MNNHKKTQRSRNHKIEKKKNIIMQEPVRKTFSPFWIAIIAVVVILGGVIVFLQTNQTVTATAPATSPNGRTGSTIAHPVATFDDGQARHFSYTDGDISIRYFVLKSADGIIRSAFDACDVCWPAGRGYAQNGDYMVCRNCGRQFASVDVNEVQGGCNPAPLTRRVENGQLVIEINDILRGKRYFDFSGKV